MLADVKIHEPRGLRRTEPLHAKGPERARLIDDRGKMGAGKFLRQ